MNKPDERASEFEKDQNSHKTVGWHSESLAAKVVENKEIEYLDPDDVVRMFLKL